MLLRLLRAPKDTLTELDELFPSQQHVNISHKVIHDSFSDYAPFPSITAGAYPISSSSLAEFEGRLISYEIMDSSYLPIPLLAQSELEKYHSAVVPSPLINIPKMASKCSDRIVSDVNLHDLFSEYSGSSDIMKQVILDGCDDQSVSTLLFQIPEEEILNYHVDSVELDLLSSVLCEIDFSLAETLEIDLGDIKQPMDVADMPISFEELASDIHTRVMSHDFDEEVPRSGKMDKPQDNQTIFKDYYMEDVVIPEPLYPAQCKVDPLVAHIVDFDDLSHANDIKLPESFSSSNLKRDFNMRVITHSVDHSSNSIHDNMYLAQKPLPYPSVEPLKVQRIMHERPSVKKDGMSDLNLTLNWNPIPGIHKVKEYFDRVTLDSMNTDETCDSSNMPWLQAIKNDSQLVNLHSPPYPSSDLEFLMETQESTLEECVKRPPNQNQDSPIQTNPVVSNEKSISAAVIQFMKARGKDPKKPVVAPMLKPEVSNNVQVNETTAFRYDPQSLLSRNQIQTAPSLRIGSMRLSYQKSLVTQLERVANVDIVFRQSPLEQAEVYPDLALNTDTAIMFFPIATISQCSQNDDEHPLALELKQAYGKGAYQSIIVILIANEKTEMISFTRPFMVGFQKFLQSCANGLLRLLVAKNNEHAALLVRQLMKPLTFECNITDNPEKVYQLTVSKVFLVC